MKKDDKEVKPQKAKSKKPEPENKGKITHHLANGEIRESMQGHMVSVNEKTKLFYQLLASYTPENKDDNGKDTA